MGNRAARVAWTAMVLLLASKSGCQCDPNVVDPPAEGFLRVYVALEPSEVDVSEFSLTLRRVDIVIRDLTSGEEFIHQVGAGVETVVIPASAKGVPLLVLSASVPVGEIAQIRLVTVDASMRYAVPGDEDFRVDPIRIPSGPQTGAKIVLRESAILEEAATLSILATVAPDHSLHRAPGNGWIFAPVITASVMTRQAIHDYLGPDDLVLNVIATELPSLGIRLERAKVLDRTTLLTRDIVLDSANGLPASFESLRAENEQTWRSLHGAVLASSLDDLALLNDDASVEAYVWIAVPPFATFMSTADTPEDADVDHTAYMQARRALHQPVVDAVRDRLLGLGVDVLDTSYDPPRLTVEASKRTMVDEVAFDEDVSLVALVEPTPPILSHAEQAIDLFQEPLFFAHLLGSGQGLRVAVVEPQACIRADHDDFQFMVIEPPLLPCSFPDGHSTAVAGAVGGFHSAGASSELIGLFAGRLFAAQQGTISEGILARNPHLVNASYLSDENDRRAFDYAVYVHRRFVQNGSGNLQGSDPMVEPARCYSYNSLCTGGYLAGVLDDTPGTLGDDIHASGAYWRNSTTTGREEPDLAGPFSIDLPVATASSGHDQWNGTSFAGPAVVGIAALLIANFPGALLNDPTLNRASLLASAFHPIKDSVDDNLVIARLDDGIDDKTGVGAPRGDLARNLLAAGNYFSARLDATADFDAAGSLLTPLNFQASAGDTVRVALTWDQCDDGMAAIADALLVDLDLVVSGPVDVNGQRQIKVNMSAVDNYEVVQFLVLESGVHTINIQQRRWDLCPADGMRSTNVAVAWHVFQL